MINTRVIQVFSPSPSTICCPWITRAGMSLICCLAIWKNWLVANMTRLSGWRTQLKILPRSHIYSFLLAGRSTSTRLAVCFTKLASRRVCCRNIMRKMEAMIGIFGWSDEEISVHSFRSNAYNVRKVSSSIDRCPSRSRSCGESENARGIRANANLLRERLVQYG